MMVGWPRAAIGVPEMRSLEVATAAQKGETVHAVIDHFIGPLAGIANHIHHSKGACPVGVGVYRGEPFTLAIAVFLDQTVL